ncbi:TonB-dependent receptor [Zavarzinia compransoris]|uniref:TonB-dependent siderophore receptor n=1 Tax=Zavarzinia compransoris TaxID=1264899 RepID=A0A317DTX3_9PROT|nr:TonB-dependent receptor [Zavarzinia compransoris]PWR17824.1 TonB-dependent siderophore receptor [Zavarzinia compransoris]TDP49357.1 catecholate siderophore receptor [Zavarzinia compransoris]
MSMISRNRVSHCAMLVLLAAVPMAAPAFAGETLTPEGNWAPTAASGQTVETLPTVSVTGEPAPANNQKRETAVDRLPQDVQDTPQTIHVINEETLEQQGVTSLEQALRNVPGVTVEIGEGGALNGDQFRIRGFSSQTDVTQDGLRDFGVYTRDTWNTESVEVFLGPSGETFGRGNFAGTINTTSKAPVLGDFITLHGELGLGLHARTTADVNRKIGDTTAVRLNLMYTDTRPVDRDGPESKRWGIAPSIGFGLGTSTELTIGYFHQEDDRVPDYGIPTTANSITGGIASAASGPAPVDRSNWYGGTLDHDDTVADVLTVRLSHQATPWLKVHNDSRLGFYTRDFLPTAPSCAGANATTGVVTAGSCLANLLDGNPATVPVASRGGPSTPTYTEQWGVQNITTGIAEFTLGGLKNQFVLGADLAYEEAVRKSNGNIGQGRPAAVDMLNPSKADWAPIYVATNNRDSDATSFALFASEQIWFTNELSLLGGLRFERYSAESTLTTFGTVTGTTFVPTTPNTTSSAEIDETLWNPRASLVWEPSDEQTYYLSWSRSSEPATGTSVGNSTNPVSTTTAVQDLQPTTSETFEVGAKLNFFGGRLGTGITVFQVERDNSKEVDPVTNTITTSGQSVRNRGLELTATGKLTEAWTVQASYAFIDSEYLDFASTDATTNALMNGREVNNVPRNSFNLWTTYVPLEALTLGAGVRYHDEMFVSQGYRSGTNEVTTTEVPYYLAVDAMAQYRFSEGLAVQVNGYNLFDREDNYDQTRSNRLVPAAGRTVIFSTTATF